MCGGFGDKYFAFCWLRGIKNGKKIEGTVVEEDAEGYRIRDSQGIVIFVKRSQLDANASQITKVNQSQIHRKPKLNSRKFHRKILRVLQR